MFINKHKDKMLILVTQALGVVKGEIKLYYKLKILKKGAIDSSGSEMDENN